MLSLWDVTTIKVEEASFMLLSREQELKLELIKLIVIV